MHYATLNNGHLGLVIDHTLIDLSVAAKALSDSVETLITDRPIASASMYDLIAAGTQGQRQVEQLAQQALTADVACMPYDDHLLRSPLGYLRRNVFCIGKNYSDHAAEIAAKLDTEVALPQHPIVFTKATNTLLGPQQTIPRHVHVTEKVDYEGELALVIGKRGRDISEAQAWSYVFGYTCYNDVSARDLQADTCNGIWAKA